jgi:SHS2 domain-containing protein
LVEQFPLKEEVGGSTPPWPTKSFLAKDYELIEHTADIGIRVKAKGLAEIFKNAALAMFDIIAEEKSQVTSHKSQVIRIKQKADNLDELFINWLNELLSLSATEELIFLDFKIDKIDDKNIQAKAFGQDMKNYRVNSEIKAATYHQLKLEETNGGWTAEVIFDV